jgi:hypothetical protein
MDLTSDEERWAVWMVQARRFAERENFTDAVARVRLVRNSVVARVRLVRNSVREALGAVSDPTGRGRLERHLARADEQLASMESQYEAWRSEPAVRVRSTKPRKRWRGLFPCRRTSGDTPRVFGRVAGSG